MDMAEVIQRNSLDDDNRRFVPDEVFETVEEARETVACLIEARHTETGPFVFALILKKDGSNIGYVQTCRTENEWEIGYHIAKAYAGNGYATEAVCAFAPVVISLVRILLNERDATVPIKDVAPHFYRWEALRDYMLGELAMFDQRVATNR